MTETQILRAKEIKSDGRNEFVLCNSLQGGVLSLNGRPVFFPHNSFRWNGENGGRTDNAVLESDTSPISYLLDVPAMTTSARLAEASVRYLHEGMLPAHLTLGVEVEGSLNDKNGDLLTRYDDYTNQVQKVSHPELLAHTVETATGKINGHYPKTPIEVAQTISQAILEGYSVAHSRGGTLTYTSVTEGGDWRDARLSPHPYLEHFAPMVLDAAMEKRAYIPQEVLDLYARIDPLFLKTLEETRVLNWPVQALHVHTGIPQLEHLVDPRSAYAVGALQKTQFAKVASLMLYNTRHMYGVDTKLRDVRSIARRLLSTAHDSSVPANAQALMHDMIRALTEGEVHSASRYPASGQHDRVRYRADGFNTVESIDAPMNPDLRLVLAWTYLNQVMNTIAIDALHNTHGDESRVLEHLQRQYGPIFAEIPTMGAGSSYEYDLSFNKSGYAGKPSGSTRNFGQMTEEIGSILTDFGKRFPALRTQIDIVTHVLRQASSQPTHQTLENYMGISSGEFDPYGGLSGIVTDYKAGVPVSDLLAIQNAGTNLQAQALANVSDETELLHFFGLI